MRYTPYGGLRVGGLPTDRQFTGQRREASLGFYDYVARQYDPALGRFLQADSIIPGAASGVGGGAATLGYEFQTRLTPLTVNLGEFVTQINAENREILQFGFFFQWDARTRQEHNVPSGPANPQALNRYAYVLNNPLRYVDPTGHYLINSLNLQMTADQVADLLEELDFWIGLAEGATDLTTVLEYMGLTLEVLALAGIALPQVTAPVGALLFFGGKGLDFTVDDLKKLQLELVLATGAMRLNTTVHNGAVYSSYKCARGAQLTMGSNLAYWGISINGQEAIGHWEVHPLVSLKGTWNGTRAFMITWYAFDYGR